MKSLLLILCLIAVSVSGAVDTIKSTTYLTDSYIYSGATSTNYGADTVWYVNATAGDAIQRRAVVGIHNYIDVIGPGKVIDSVFYHFYVQFKSTTNPTITFYPILKPVFEDSMNWAKWRHSPTADSSTHDSAWGKAGADSIANGAANRGNGTGPDRKSSPDGSSVTITGTGWYSFKSVAPVLWYDTTYQYPGLVVVPTTAGAVIGMRAYSSEFTRDASLVPFWVVYSHDLVTKTIASPGFRYEGGYGGYRYNKGEKSKRH